MMRHAFTKLGLCTIYLVLSRVASNDMELAYHNCDIKLYKVLLHFYPIFFYLM